MAQERSETKGTITDTDNLRANLPSSFGRTHWSTFQSPPLSSVLLSSNQRAFRLDTVFSASRDLEYIQNLRQHDENRTPHPHLVVDVGIPHPNTGQTQFLTFSTLAKFRAAFNNTKDRSSFDNIFSLLLQLVNSNVTVHGVLGTNCDDVIVLIVSTLELESHDRVPRAGRTIQGQTTRQLVNGAIIANTHKASPNISYSILVTAPTNIEIVSIGVRIITGRIPTLHPLPTQASSEVRLMKAAAFLTEVSAFYKRSDAKTQRTGPGKSSKLVGEVDLNGQWLTTLSKQGESHSIHVTYPMNNNRHGDQGGNDDGNDDDDDDDDDDDYPEPDSKSVRLSSGSNSRSRRSATLRSGSPSRRSSTSSRSSSIPSPATIGHRSRGSNSNSRSNSIQLSTRRGSFNPASPPTSPLMRHSSPSHSPPPSAVPSPLSTPNPTSTNRPSRILTLTPTPTPTPTPPPTPNTTPTPSPRLPPQILTFDQMSGNHGMIDHNIGRIRSREERESPNVYYTLQQQQQRQQHHHHHQQQPLDPLALAGGAAGDDDDEDEADGSEVKGGMSSRGSYGNNDDYNNDMEDDGDVYNRLQNSNSHSMSYYSLSESPEPNHSLLLPHTNSTPPIPSTPSSLPFSPFSPFSSHTFTSPYSNMNTSSTATTNAINTINTINTTTSHATELYCSYCYCPLISSRCPYCTN